MSVGPEVPTIDGDSLAKIHFDLTGFTEEGLYGPPDGLRALDYEFCIPADPALVDEVRAIDPTLSVFPDSPGRIGCGVDEYLCIGTTHQPDFRAVLLRLAELEYVQHIVPSYGE